MLVSEIKNVINNEIKGTGSFDSVVNSIIFLKKVKLLDEKSCSHLISIINKHKNIKKLDQYINSEKFIIDFNILFL